MLAEERFTKITALVNEYRTVTVLELAEMLNVSEATVRRDLTYLDTSGLIKKVHGGAASIELGRITKDASFGERKRRNYDEKIRIAKQAAEMIESDDFVFLDAGTTTELLAECAVNNGAQFVTNAISHVKILADKGIKTYLIGGEYKSSTEAVIGAEALQDLERYNFTKGFFGVNGITVKTGFSTPDVSEAMVKKKAMAGCRNKYVLADKSKFGIISSVTFAPLEGTVIITSEIQDSEFSNIKGIIEVNKL